MKPKPNSDYRWPIATENNVHAGKHASVKSQLVSALQLIISALDSGPSGWSPGRVTALCYWVTLYCHGASLHPGVMSTGEFNSWGNPVMD